jgi:hypothetical protein
LPGPRRGDPSCALVAANNTPRPGCVRRPGRARLIRATWAARIRGWPGSTSLRPGQRCVTQRHCGGGLLDERRRRGRCGLRNGAGRSMLTKHITATVDQGSAEPCWESHHRRPSGPPSENQQPDSTPMPGLVGAPTPGRRGPIAGQRGDRRRDSPRLVRHGRPIGDLLRCRFAPLRCYELIGAK